MARVYNFSAGPSTLPEVVLEKIYYRNFQRLAGNHPRELDPRAIVEECERLMMIGAMGSMQPEEPGDPSVAQMVKSYFEAQM